MTGHHPSLAIEITRECPLRCPGCYAYNDEHLGGETTLRQLRDYKGQALIDGVLRLVDEHRPLHVSIVGGEPLVRYRELDAILPVLSGRGIHVQVVTSAVREIPPAWCALPRVDVVVSIDGLAPEHDVRRAPATYERILKHIAGRRIAVHCTITRQQVRRPGYLKEFVAFWSAREETYQIRVSLYTPQIGEVSDEMLSPADRARVITDLMALRARYPKLFGAAVGVGRLHESATVAERVRLRSDDPQRVGRSADLDHALYVRRLAGLRELRMPRIGRPGGDCAPPDTGRYPGRHGLQSFASCRRAGQAVAQPRGRGDGCRPQVGKPAQLSRAPGSKGQ